MISRYRSNGKLLISGEYVILDGAIGLAMPVNKGSELQVDSTDQGADEIQWATAVQGQVVFEAKFSREGKLISSNGNETGKALEQIFKAMDEVAGEPVFKAKKPVHFYSSLDFPMNWGLGSSSTLLSNLATWAEIDVYELSSKTFGGSGYDLACATATGPLLYWLENGGPTVEATTFNPAFSGNLFFVYLNRKMNSREAIQKYRAVRQSVGPEITNRISAISRALTLAKDLKTFIDLIKEHEQLMAKVLHQNPVAKVLFPDYNGAVKSLGAWGGDFVLAASETDGSDYFRNLGYDVVFAFDDLKLKST